MGNAKQLPRQFFGKNFLKIKQNPKWVIVVAHILTTPKTLFTKFSKHLKEPPPRLTRNKFIVLSLPKRSRFSWTLFKELWEIGGQLVSHEVRGKRLGKTSIGRSRTRGPIDPDPVDPVRGRRVSFQPHHDDDDSTKTDPSTTTTRLMSDQMSKLLFNCFCLHFLHLFLL